MFSCKPVDTSVSSSSKLFLASRWLYYSPTWYRQIVGALQYLTFTRPDICYAVNKVCQFMHSTTNDHWPLVKLILCYLKGTGSYKLHITRSSSFSLHSFTNIDWVNIIDDRKSTSDYLVNFSNTPISWKSRKQWRVARSSTEVEYKALVDGAAKILWLRSLLS